MHIFILSLPAHPLSLDSTAFEWVNRFHLAGCEYCSFFSRHTPDTLVEIFDSEGKQVRDLLCEKHYCNLHKAINFAGNQHTEHRIGKQYEQFSLEKIRLVLMTIKDRLSSSSSSSSRSLWVECDYPPGRVLIVYLQIAEEPNSRATNLVAVWA